LGLLQNTPLHPIPEWGRIRFGGVDIPGEQRLADLESSLSQVKLDAVENAALLAPLLDIPLPHERVPTLPSEELRRRQLAALTNWVTAGARVQPVVLALEDVHWADPTTLELLRGVAERGALSPLFVLITARPEFPPTPRGPRARRSVAPTNTARSSRAEVCRKKMPSRDSCRSPALAPQGSLRGRGRVAVHRKSDGLAGGRCPVAPQASGGYKPCARAQPFRRERVKRAFDALTRRPGRAPH
jgi:hypothetical protein